MLAIPRNLKEAFGIESLRLSSLRGIVPGTIQTGCPLIICPAMRIQLDCLLSPGDHHPTSSPKVQT